MIGIPFLGFKKKVRLCCSEFSKNRDCVAKDFLKSAMLVPAIIRKDPHRPLPKSTRPTNNHQGFPMKTCRVVRFFTENARVRIRGFF